LKVVAEELDAKVTNIADVLTKYRMTFHVDEDVQQVVQAMAENQLQRNHFYLNLGSTMYVEF
jgi:hypothetical protein